MFFEAYHNGLNLGGWLALHEIIAGPSPARQERHFEAFITKTDIQRIAGWGFDHVRLPVSAYLLYDKQRRELAPPPLQYIHRCVGWCREAGLNLILDLHDIEGNVYGAMDSPMPLLAEPALGEAFCHIWELLAASFAGVREPRIAFELLNEVSDPSEYLWNKLWQEALRRIRAVDPERPVLVGSSGQNSVAYLDQLEVVEDPWVFYNFHYYEPLAFTHQRAHFSEEIREYGQTVTYPGDISGFGRFLEEHPEYQQKHALCRKEQTNDRALMEKLCGLAIQFQKKTGKELYCGEFGVIDSAPPEEAAKWLKDLTGLLDSHRIGHALWNYKALDFGLLDTAGNLTAQPLLAAVLSGRDVDSGPALSKLP